MTDDTMRARLTCPSSDRDHAQGSGDARGDAGRIRRLRVPLLRAGLSDRQGSAASDCGIEAAIRVPELPDQRHPSSRRARGGGGRSRRRARAVLGDARSPVRAPAALDDRHLAALRTSSSTLDVERFEQELPRTSTPLASTKTS